MNNILLIILVIASLWTVMTRSLLKASLGLAVTSAIVAIMLFRLDSPLAGVFELSVCAGLITAVFISAISLMKPLTYKETVKLAQKRLKRYLPLPIIIIIAGFILSKSTLPSGFNIPAEAIKEDVRNVLWDLRPMDLFGQMVIVLAGVFGTVILFKEIKKKK